MPETQSTQSQLSSLTRVDPPSDTEMAWLLSQDRIDNARRKADNEMNRRQLTTEEFYALRRRCKTDKMFLATILGYGKLTERLHGDFCGWLEETEGIQFRLILLPRGHYKTTLATIVDSVQAALPADNTDVSEPRNLGTNVRIMLGHETHDGASRFLYSITQHFTSCLLLMGLYPECVPNLREQRMNKFELELPRTERWSEPTFDTFGVGGKSQGRHFDIIKLDDLFGDKARDSLAERSTTYDWFDNIQSFFIDLVHCHMDLIGTRWAVDDLYAHAKKMYEEQLIEYCRSVEEVNVETKVKEPIFPENFPREKLKILRKNVKVWSAQYLNDPKEGMAEFLNDWKRFYEWSGTNRITVFTGEKSDTLDIFKHLDRVVLVDPAMVGYGGVVTTGTDQKTRVFVLEAQKFPWKPPELVEYLFRLVSRWQPRVVAIEEVLFSGLFKHWLEREMQIRGIRFSIIPVKTRQREKEVRVKGLSNYFASGQIFFNDAQDDLIEEYDTFGATEDYHLLDALAYGPEVWRPARQHETWDARKDADEDAFKDRDVETGYSQI